MIIGYIQDPYVRAGLLRAGHPEEDVVLDPVLADEAMAYGYPRLVVCTTGEGGSNSSGTRLSFGVVFRLGRR